MLVQVPLQTMAVTFSVFSLLLPVQAYIPAIPTNDTAVAFSNGTNVTETSQLVVEWYSLDPNLPGEAAQTISYQVVGKNSNDTTKGVFVQFSEDDITGAADDTTITPWIALISCDANSTRASQVWDVFTLAYQRGACGALLYSAWSQACIINPEYKDPKSDIYRPMDVFSTQSLESANLILSLFSYLGDSADGEYNPSALNASQAIINQSLKVGPSAESGYLFSTLLVHNAMAPSVSDWEWDYPGDEPGEDDPDDEPDDVPDVPDFEPDDGPDLPDTVSGGVTSSKITLVMFLVHVITGCIVAFYLL